MTCKANLERAAGLPFLAAMIAKCHSRLKKLAAAPANPDSNWTVDAQLPCVCQHCLEVKAFFGQPREISQEFGLQLEDKDHVIR